MSRQMIDHKNSTKTKNSNVKLTGTSRGKKMLYNPLNFFSYHGTDIDIPVLSSANVGIL
jgi:hypothetical protein